MTAAPPLSSSTASRMEKAAEAALAAVDAGVHPDAAVAKAASEYGLTPAHAAHVCHAVNIGQAAGTRTMGDNPWEKAAGYPVADPKAVAALLGAGPAAVAKAAGCGSAPGPHGDYRTPPVAKAAKAAAAPRPAVPAAAKAAECPAGECCPHCSARLERDPDAGTCNSCGGPWPAKSAKARVNDYRLRVHAARALDAARSAAAAASPAEYAGAKEAALATNPAAAGFLFPVLERDPAVAKKAAAAPAPVGVSHPLVKAAAAVAGVAALVPPPGPIPFRTPTKAADAAGPAAPKVGPVQSFFRDASSSLIGGSAKALVSGNPAAWGAPTLVGETEASRARDQAVADAHKDQATAALQAPLGKAEDAAQGVAEQDHVNRLLVDPTLRTHDPRAVLTAYRGLKAMAPLTMSNPDMARQLVHMRMSTGPLALYDLNTLATLEKNLAQARRAQSGEDN